MSAVGTVFRKELLDVLRDRRTLLFMLVIPTLSIPLMMWLTADLVTSFMEKMARKQVDVLVLNAEAAPDLVEELRQRSNPMGLALQLSRLLESRGLTEKDLSLVKGEDPRAFERLLTARGIDRDELMGEVRGLMGAQEFEPNVASLIGSAFPPNFRVVTELDKDLGDPRDPAQREAVLLQAVRTDRLGAAVLLPADARERLARGDTAELQVFYLDSSDRSTLAFKGLEGIFRSMGKRITAERLAERQLPPGLASPLKLKPTRLPGPGLLIKIMGQLLPYMILIFAFLGALYPAIDLGAGEKERGTLETLLVAPVSRLSLVLGKFLVVLLAALVSAVLATVSLGLSLQIGFLAELSLLSGGTFSFSFLEGAMALAMILPVSCIFSALLLALSIFAKSFKEGQSYAGPLQLVVIMPAFVSFLPGVELDWFMASMPVVNVSLALKEIFTGNLDQHWGHMGLIFLSTSVCAGLLLWAAAWWFRREQVLFRS
ncbi:MAG TPA: ABC transporter permease subunit [Myxococcota bacterium]|nr:ABC transporter permease subunit [Myxococcota bacterium]HRY93381.1 ABC transporter permease subunit [Myxococcota bacterium]HSA24362.1 ABC transporter permease subunit [Myxococcota bacterium]